MAGYRRGTREEREMRKKSREGKEPKKTEVTIYWRTELTKNGRLSEESIKTFKHDILDFKLEDWVKDEIDMMSDVLDRMNNSDDEANYTSTTVTVYKSKRTNSTVVTFNNLKEFEKNGEKYEKTFHKSYNIDKLIDL